MIINAINPQTKSKTTFGAPFDNTCMSIALKAAEKKKITNTQAMELIKIHFDETTKHIGVIAKQDKDTIEISLLNTRATENDVKKGTNSFPLHFVNNNKFALNNLENFFAGLNLKDVKDQSRTHLDPTIPQESTEGSFDVLLKAFNSKSKASFENVLRQEKTSKSFSGIAVNG